MLIFELAQFFYNWRSSKKTNQKKKKANDFALKVLGTI